VIVVRRKRRRLILNRAPLCGTEPHVRRPRMLSRMRLRVSHKKMYHHRQRRASSRPSGDPSGDPFVFLVFFRGRPRFHTGSRSSIGDCR
jgi:hypothetical protein